MIFTPIGIGSAFAKAAYGYACTLVDNHILLDAAPQVMLQLRQIGVSADDVDAVLISHFHGDHVFGLPFLLAERSRGQPPLRVLGPAGAGRRLEALCSLAFSRADPAKMSIRELPPDGRAELVLDQYSVRSAPTEHTEHSVGYSIRDRSGLSLALSGDAAWSDGLCELLGEADAALVEMTFLDPGPQNHLSLAEHLPRALQSLPSHAKLFVNHLSEGREDYLAAIEALRIRLPPAAAAELKRVCVVEELKSYEV